MLNTVALIDDDRTTNYIHRRLIQKLNFAKNILVFDDAQKAVEYMEKCAEDNTDLPDLILVDVEMPKMNGFQVIDRIKKMANFNPSSNKIAFLSNYKFSELVEETFVSKPLTSNRLESFYNN